MHCTNTNLQFTFRHLRRTPAFTLTVVLTLALGIGATTAIFSLVEGVLLRPLPFQDADRLVLVGRSSGRPAQACPLGLAKSKRTHLRPGRFPLWGGYITTSFELLEAHSQNKSMPHASIPKCFRRSAFSPSSAVSLRRKKTMPVNRSP